MGQGWRSWKEKGMLTGGQEDKSRDQGVCNLFQEHWKSLKVEAGAGCPCCCRSLWMGQGQVRT